MAQKPFQTRYLQATLSTAGLGRQTRLYSPNRSAMGEEAIDDRPYDDECRDMSLLPHP